MQSNMRRRARPEAAGTSVGEGGRDVKIQPVETGVSSELETDVMSDFSRPSTTESSSLDLRQTVGTLQLTALVFYSVSGGPFGIEEAVRSAGPFFCLLGFLVGPLVWSIPEAAMTAELGSTYPDASGGVVWVEHAFGDRAAWTCGFLAFISGFVDMAIYPTLFLDYVLQVVDTKDPNHLVQYTAVCTFAIILSYINYRGLTVVGHLSTVICVVSMSPFVLAFILGLFKIQPHRWFRWPQEYVDNTNTLRTGVEAVLWRPFLNNLFWNLNSFDSAASFSSEVEDPGRSFPRAMLWSSILVASSYLFPLLIVLGVSGAPQSAWVDGYMATAISSVDGIWLERWLVFAAGITNVALFQAEMASDAFQVMGMADRGYLPRVFASRSQYGTPTYGILIGTLIVLLMSLTNLETMIELLNFNYACE